MKNDRIFKYHGMLVPAFSPQSKCRYGKPTHIVKYLFDDLSSTSICMVTSSIKIGLCSNSNVFYFSMSCITLERITRIDAVFNTFSTSIICDLFRSQYTRVDATTRTWQQIGIFNVIIRWICKLVIDSCLGGALIWFRIQKSKPKVISHQIAKKLLFAWFGSCACVNFYLTTILLPFYFYQ